LGEVPPLERISSPLWKHRELLDMGGSPHRSCDGSGGEGEARCTRNEGTRVVAPLSDSAVGADTHLRHELLPRLPHVLRTVAEAERSLCVRRVGTREWDRSMDATTAILGALDLDVNTRETYSYSRESRLASLGCSRARCHRTGREQTTKLRRSLG
jgi:hypothetical protein